MSRKLTIKRRAIFSPRDARALPIEVSHRYDAHSHDVECEVEEDESEKNSVCRLRAMHIVHHDRTAL